MRNRSRHVVLLALLVGTACTRLAERAFTRPTIAVRGVRVRSVGLSGGSLDVALAIANPNPYPIPVQRATYAFALLDSSEVGRGESAEAFTLPARDSTVIHLPLELSWRGLRAVARDAAPDGMVDFRIDGTVTIDTPFGDPSVPFSEAGRFTAPPSIRSLP